MDVMFILSLLEFPMETSGQIFALLSSLLLLTFPRNAKRKLALHEPKCYSSFGSAGFPHDLIYSRFWCVAILDPSCFKAVWLINLCGTEKKAKFSLSLKHTWFPNGKVAYFVSRLKANVKRKCFLDLGFLFVVIHFFFIYESLTVFQSIFNSK